MYVREVSNINNVISRGLYEELSCYLKRRQGDLLQFVVSYNVLILNFPHPPPGVTTALCLTAAACWTDET